MDKRLGFFGESPSNEKTETFTEISLVYRFPPYDLPRGLNF